MVLLEYEGKALLRRYGIATPSGYVAADERTLEQHLTGVGRRVLKAQVPTGRRGQSGAILFADGQREIVAAYRDLRQRRVGEHPVETVLVEEFVDAHRERYAAVHVAGGELSLLLAKQGGINVEEISERDESNWRSVPLSVLDGPDMTLVGEALEALDFPPASRPLYQQLVQKLYQLSRDYDLATAEINPIVERDDDTLVALDARLVVDEAALARHPEFSSRGLSRGASVPSHNSGGLRFRENPDGGTVGLIGLGSGLNVLLMDWVFSMGSQIASLVDIDDAIASGRAQEGVTRALNHYDRSPDIKSILVCIITCGYRLDQIVVELIEAMRQRATPKPTFLYLRGNALNVASGLLATAGLENASSLSNAVAEAVAASSALSR